MSLKNKSFIIIVMITSFAFIIYLSKGLISPYVSVKKAKMSSRNVQIIGHVGKNYPVILNDNLEFYLVDENGDNVKIVYKGNLAKNFQHSEKIVVVGKYSKKEGIFQAKKILLKCPSKYKEKSL